MKIVYLVYKRKQDSKEKKNRIRIELRLNAVSSIVGLRYHTYCNLLSYYLLYSKYTIPFMVPKVWKHSSMPSSLLAHTTNIKEPVNYITYIIINVLHDNI